MAYYLSKYVGKYRLLSEYDLNTNDFAKDLNGTYETGNIYIKCANDSKIFYWGRGILTAYVPSLIRGKNILKSIGESNGIDLKKYQIGEDGNQRFDFNTYLKDLLELKIVFDVEETDGEFLWKFKDKYTDLMAELLRASKYGAKRPPFSPKNLPIREYTIPKEDMKKYKDIVSTVPKEKFVLLTHIQKNFISGHIPKKHKEYRKADMNVLMRKEQLRGKEFIHYLGFWDEYMQYIQKEVKKVIQC